MAVASRTQTVHFVKTAEKGAKPLGPLKWTSVATGFKFLSGGLGEESYHIVYYNGSFYQCKTTHNKTASNYPGSTAGSSLWSLIETYECVATALLIANYILVENLGVSALEMYDSSGNVVCKIKDGSIICNTGTFKDVNVTGNIYMKDSSGNAVFTAANGDVTCNKGTFQNVDVIGNFCMKNSSGNVVFSAVDGNVKCKQGTFEGVDVNGNITAKTLGLTVGSEDDINSASFFNMWKIWSSGITLLALEEGTSKEWLFWYPAAMKGPSVELKSADDTVLCFESPKTSTSQSILTISQGTVARLIGFREKGATYTYYILCQYS
jgi:hypothetical protein